jgi:hypothetical protein
MQNFKLSIFCPNEFYGYICGCGKAFQQKNGTSLFGYFGLQSNCGIAQFQVMVANDFDEVANYLKSLDKQNISMWQYSQEFHVSLNKFKDFYLKQCINPVSVVRGFYCYYVDVANISA